MVSSLFIPLKWEVSPITFPIIIRLTLKTGQPELDEAGNKITLQGLSREEVETSPQGFFSNQAASPRYRGDGSDLGFYYQHSWELKDGFYGI
jgi:hypothetical protein